MLFNGLYLCVCVCVQASKRHVSEDVAKQIHEKVAPVITWLRTAEEESDDDEDGDEEGDEGVEVVYSNTASHTKITTETVQVENVSVAALIHMLLLMGTE